MTEKQDNENGFDFETHIKAIKHDIDKENLDKLVEWHVSYEQYRFYDTLCESAPSEDNLVLLRNKIDHLVTKHPMVESITSRLYIETPDPDTIGNQWDAGKTKRELNLQLRALSNIKMCIENSYISVLNTLARLYKARTNTGKVKPSSGCSISESMDIVANNQQSAIEGVDSNKNLTTLPVELEESPSPAMTVNFDDLLEE